LVDVYIGTKKMNVTPYVVPAGGQVTPNYSGEFGGPLHVVSTNGQAIMASERAIFGSSFTETLGTPGGVQLATEYWFTWYDGLFMQTWVSIGAPDTNTGNALVDVYMGTRKMNVTPYVVPAGGGVTPNYSGEFGGPLRVVSTNGQKIFASERAIFGNSFTETLGIPGGTRLTTDYWFTWYDGQFMQTWVSIGAPSTNSGSALVDVYVGGTKMNVTPYSVPPGGGVTPNYIGAFAGPVHVVSTNGQDIFASERAIYGSSFTETLGMPGDQLTTDYWFTWYDGLFMQTWLSIGKP
jgi:hypothetical protein